jgi:L-iditol 2-dehydrogenase
MKAAILTDKKKLIIHERPAPSCADDEIIIRAEYCGICRTDRKAYHSGQRDLNMPRVLGHEISGRVSEAGADFAAFEPGERVVIHPGVHCKTCEYCAAGRDNLCGDMKILGFHVDGGFQEYIKLNKKDETNIIRIPDSITSSEAALSEPLACAVHQKKMFGAGDSRKVLIVGSGALGVLSAKLWHESGKNEVVITDVNPGKIKIASEIGLNVYDKDNLAVNFGREYFDFALVCCPVNDGLKAGIHYLKKGGALGFFSGLTEPAIETRALNEIHYKELKIYGSYGCNLSDTKDALGLLGDFAIPGDLIKITGLEQVAGILANSETENIFTQIKFI